MHFLLDTFRNSQKFFQIRRKIIKGSNENGKKYKMNQ